MAGQYSNQAAAEWARRNLAQEIEIKLRENSWPARVLVVLAMLFLGAIFFGIPAILLLNAAAKFLTNGWGAEVSRLLRLGIFFLAGFGGLAVFLFFYVRSLRRKLVRFLSADGVTTRGGGKYRWENLQYLDYVTVHRNFVRGYRVYHVLLRALSNYIFAGFENLKIEMVFTDGTATLAPLIEDQREVLDLLDTIPARRKSDGKS
ncbi:MAG: hypothetical protein JOZ02_18180 [Acidobacteria bacterium]|nr:hypothetical protein [Acidobacteriota bacterium]